MSETSDLSLSPEEIKRLGSRVAQKLMLTNSLHGLAVGAARDERIAPDLTTKDQWEVVKAAIRELADQIDY